MTPTSELKQTVMSENLLMVQNSTTELDLDFILALQQRLSMYLDCFVPDEDSNLATSPLPDMDSDSMLGGPVDEEERWLDALEKGELDDNGELKKEIDESLLTARQVRSSCQCCGEHFHLCLTLM